MKDDLHILMYMIVNKRGTGEVMTLEYKRKDCISKFLKDTSLTWTQAKKVGWKCMKVDVVIMPSSNEDYII